MKSTRMLLAAAAVVIAVVVILNVNGTNDPASEEADLSSSATTGSMTPDSTPTEMVTLKDPPAVGDEAPAITLESNEGNMVRLSDYKGSWVVLYFYPKDFTRGCTIQAQKFQKDLAEYHDRNAVILGVSLDTADSHKEFCAKESLEFKLLADIGGHVSGAYGSLNVGEELSYSARNTFVIDPEGVVAKVFMKVNPTPHSQEVLAALDELQTD